MSWADSFPHVVTAALAAVNAQARLVTAEDVNDLLTVETVGQSWETHVVETIYLFAKRFMPDATIRREAPYPHPPQGGETSTAKDPTPKGLTSRSRTQGEGRTGRSSRSSG